MALAADWRRHGAPGVSAPGGCPAGGALRARPQRLRQFPGIRRPAALQAPGGA